MELNGLSWEPLRRNTTQKCRNLSELKSSTAIFVCQEAPVSCQIWFSCKGYLIWTRCEDVHLSRLIKLPSQMNKCTLFPQCLEEDPKSLSSHDLNSPRFVMDELETDGSPSCSPIKSQDSPCSSSSNLLEDEFREQVAIGDKLDNNFPDAENSMEGACEETVLEHRAKEEVFKSIHRGDEASESSYIEELILTQRIEMEDLLVHQKQELEAIQDKHNKILSELQLVQKRKSSLESEILENYDTEKELEEKIIQAVNLMISFKEKRDMLRVECESAHKEAQKLRKFIKENVAVCNPNFFAFSFLDIMEATQNLDPSMKIGDGKFGSVYKGIIHQSKVAIKILSTGGYQSDSAFEHEAELLSRVRHPHVVTLIGACTESRSLIYEYLENGSLEDHLSGRSKKHPLPWQLRLRIASEICSVLIFLHAERCCIVHGNLKLSNVLLDANCVSKISGLRTNNLRGGGQINVGRHTKESDLYSFGIIILRILTARPVSTIIKDVKCAMEVGSPETILDNSAGDWPLELVEQLIPLALRCCHGSQSNRPDLAAEVMPVIEPFRNLNTFSCLESSTSSKVETKDRGRIPSHFVCPIFQEVMKDPYIAADGFTYEEDAIKGWLNSGHETSPMTNLQLDHCELLPNYALYYAIQEWQRRP